MLMAQLCFPIFVAFHIGHICLEPVRLQLLFKRCCIFSCSCTAPPCLWIWSNWLSARVARRNSTGEDATSKQNFFGLGLWTPLKSRGNC